MTGHIKWKWLLHMSEVSRRACEGLPVRLNTRTLCRLASSTDRPAGTVHMHWYSMQTNYKCSTVQTHFWQQVLRFHNRAVKMPNSRLVKLALVDGAQMQNDHVVDLQQKCWRSNVSTFLATQPRHPCLFGNLDVADIVHHQKEATQSALIEYSIRQWPA